MEFDIVDAEADDEVEVEGAGGWFWRWMERASVSDFMSERTWAMRSGKVVHCPERRRERACVWIMVGQLVGWEWRVWRRVSWILGEDRLVSVSLCLLARIFWKLGGKGILNEIGGIEGGESGNEGKEIEGKLLCDMPLSY